MSCTPPTGLTLRTTMTLGAADAVVVPFTPVPVAGADVLLLLLLLPPPDCAITNATTATTTTSPSTAQRVPVFIEDLLQSISDRRRTIRRRSDQTEVSGGPRPARKRASGSGEGWKTA